MSLADLAMRDSSESGKQKSTAKDAASDLFDDAASNALGLWADGKKSEAVRALRGAIDARVAEYLSEDDDD